MDSVDVYFESLVWPGPEIAKSNLFHFSFSVIFFNFDFLFPYYIWFWVVFFPTSEYFKK